MRQRFISAKCPLKHAASAAFPFVFFISHDFQDYDDATMILYFCAHIHDMRSQFAVFAATYTQARQYIHLPSTAAFSTAISGNNTYISASKEVRT